MMRTSIRMGAGLILLTALALALGCGGSRKAAAVNPDGSGKGQILLAAAEPHTVDESGGALIAQSETATQQETADETAEEFNDGFDDGFDDGFGDEEQQQQAQVNDPFEGWNRFWFQFNDGLYFALIKPVTQGYKYVTPEDGRVALKNATDNLEGPIRFINCLLQGKFMQAGVEFSSFVGNTAFGLGGLLDVTANKKKVVEPTDEDLGQTLGVWGAGHGPYIVWPVLGPSSVRNTVGKVGDGFADPANYLNPWYYSAAYDAGKMVNNLSFRLGEYQSLKDSAFDPYIALRNGYLQMREAKVKK